MRIPRYTKSDVLRGVLIYPLGDTIAALILHQFSPMRLAGMILVGGLIYSLEIPAWFAYINGRFGGTRRALMAMLYFNPLWIARHFVFISLFSGQSESIHWSIILVSLKSFALNLPVAFAANYCIQNKMSLRWRFLSSAVFSSLMAIYYALSRVIFE